MSGGAFGAGLGRNVFDAYRFLIRNSGMSITILTDASTWRAAQIAG